MAWHVMGWEPAFFSEIEPFPCSVLQHHYPNVPNLGDMTKYEEWPDHAIDLLVGGTPCQSFSVAGLRQGLADPRGNLMLTYLAIARRYQPRWLVWENVPGVLSSNGGRDFGTFIRGLEECGYHAAWRVLDAQYVRVDGFPYAVPQRRRRVFVVGYLGDWRRAAAVLLEREGMRGDSAPSRSKGERSAPTLSTGTRGVGDFELGGGLIGGFDHENNAHGPHDVTGPLMKGSPTGGGKPLPAIVTSTGNVAHCLNAGGMGRQDYETETMIATRPVAATLTRGAESAGKGGYAGRRQEDDENLVARAFTISENAGGFAWESDVSPTLQAKAQSASSNQFDGIRQGWAVRRLTPAECERLQGFPDKFTSVPHRGKPAADGPRYKALGNSMAVNCMRWLGRRIEAVEAYDEARSAA